MTLIVYRNHFNTFAGFQHNVEDKNEKLDKYIKLFLTTDDLKYFQVQLSNCTTADTIAYIVHKVDLKHFIRTDFNIDGSVKEHWLCFYKED